MPYLSPAAREETAHLGRPILTGLPTWEPSAPNAIAINATIKPSRRRARVWAVMLVSVALCAGVFATPAVASASADKAVAFHCALHRQGGTSHQQR